MGLYTFHLFAGAGGGVAADLYLGHKIIGAVEKDCYAQKVLISRQLDGTLPRFPIFDDIKNFSIKNPQTKNYIERLREVSNELAICGGFP